MRAERDPYAFTDIQPGDSRVKRTFAWFAIAILLLPVSLLAQRTGRVQGIVTDDMGVPLRGVTIRVIAASSEGAPLRGDIAAPDGSYGVPRLRPGFYRVLATMVGRGPVDLPAVRVRAGRTTVADFTLTFVPIVYDTIMVRAKRTPQPQVVPNGGHALLLPPRSGRPAAIREA
jgi:hypothetical protein